MFCTLLPYFTMWVIVQKWFAILCTHCATWERDWHTSTLQTSHAKMIIGFVGDWFSWMSVFHGDCGWHHSGDYFWVPVHRPLLTFYQLQLPVCCLIHVLCYEILPGWDDMSCGISTIAPHLHDVASTWQWFFTFFSLVKFRALWIWESQSAWPISAQ